MKKILAMLLCISLLMLPLALPASAASAKPTTQLTWLAGLRTLLQKTNLFKFSGGSSYITAQTKPDTQPAKSVTVPLPSSTGTAMANAVLNEVNRYRAMYGLAALTLDSRLNTLAFQKATDLHDNRYFAHQSPTYGSAFDMMRAAGISYRHAGENLAMGYSSAESVVAAWMNSSGHRANLLSANYTRMGLGYIADGGYFAQMFIG